MRALTRMRTLAAACALLLVIAGMAAAGVPGRPIDRPESPPPSPTEVGEPDTGQGLTYWRQLLIAAQFSNPWFGRIASLVLIAIRQPDVITRGRGR